MTAIEDPDAQLSSEAVGPDHSKDELEHWLSDLRTEDAANPSGWINGDSAGEEQADQAVEHRPRPTDQPATGTSEPGGAGRRRAPE